MVGDFTREITQASNGKLPVWMTLQIAFSGVTKPGKTLRFPTLFEERFMAYEAIINGARGLVFFGGNLPTTLNPRDKELGWNWTFWRNVQRSLLVELTDAAHTPALIAPVASIGIAASASARLA